MADEAVTPTITLGAQHTFAANDVIAAGFWFVVSPTFGVKIPPGNSVITYVAGEYFQSDGTWTSATGGQIAAPVTSGQPPIIQPAPVPPSVTGETLTKFKSGSATAPATPISITGTPIIPTSPFPPGGGVGAIDNPVGVPTFPPPTPPPIGHVPAGPLVGPAVAPAPVPPSLAGVVQPQFKTGSATAPAANGYFPLFTTTTAYAGFPNQPPAGVPIVFANVYTGAKPPVIPPSTPTTGQIILDGWGLPGPSGLGPGPPTYPNPPGAGRPNVASVRDGHEELSERSAGSVLSGANPAQLHQSEPPPNSRRKRMSASDPAGRANGT